jgi:hypothetical protein
MLREILLVTTDAACVCAAILFLVAAWSKLRERATLAAVIANYRLLPGWAVAPTALLLPWVELAIGVALLIGERRVAPTAGAGLLLIFAFAIEINIRRGRAFIDCGCGLGGLRQPLRRAFVVRNALIGGVMLMGLLVPGTLQPFDRITALLAGGVVFLLLLLLNALLALPGLDRQPT